MSFFDFFKNTSPTSGEKPQNSEATLAEAQVTIANQSLHSLFTKIGLDPFELITTVARWEHSPRPTKTLNSFQGWTRDIQRKGMALSVNISEWMTIGRDEAGKIIQIPGEKIELLVANTNTQFNLGLKSVELVRITTPQGKADTKVTVDIEEPGFTGHITLDSATGMMQERTTSDIGNPPDRAVTLTALADSIYSRVFHFAKKYSKKNSHRPAEPMELARVLIESISQGVELTPYHDSPLQEIKLYEDSGFDPTQVHEKFGYSSIKHRLSEIFLIAVPSITRSDARSNDSTSRLRFDTYGSAALVEHLISDLNLGDNIQEAVVNQPWKWKQIVGFPTQPQVLWEYNQRLRVKPAPLDGNTNRWPENSIHPDLVAGVEQTLQLPSGQLTIGVSALVGAQNQGEQCCSIRLDLNEDQTLESITYFERVRANKIVRGLAIQPQQTRFGLIENRKKVIYIRLTKATSDGESKYEIRSDNPFIDTFEEGEILNMPILQDLNFENTRERVYALFSHALSSPMPKLSPANLA